MGLTTIHIRAIYVSVSIRTKLTEYVSVVCYTSVYWIKRHILSILDDNQQLETGLEGSYVYFEIVINK